MKMKKLNSLLLVLAMCLFLVACGGPDKQPAIDAHNRAAEAVNAVSEILNQDPETYGEYFDSMQSLIDSLDKCADLLEGDDDLSQEVLDKIVKDCDDIEEWAKAAKAELEQ